LELEYLNGSGNSNTGKEISIQFSKVEMEPGTERTLILKHPNRYIPQNIEDTGDLTLRLYSVNDSITVMVEVVNVKEFTLRAKLNKSADLFDTDLADIYKAVIDIRNPIFLLDELRKNFIRLPFEDSFNLQRNLTENIEFIFGPPGTGKTTHLATKILIPLMKKEEGLKILVLTPTNKAADVLVNTIIKTMDDDESYVHWLVRFGLTGDKAIEQSPIFRDKSFDIRSKSKNVTITTIARFPYDYFQPDRLDHRLHLRELHWDFIVIDEASMIPLVNIIFPLYYKTDTKFIIAGDPFQIQPITSVSEWKDENIYTMIELDNFKNPTTIPHNYRIVNLPTQYRSIPSIGTLFSHFTYNGILENHRKRSSQKELKINGLKIEDINIIRFPVSPFETIYKAKRLNNSSSYHIYSAIFTYEFAKFISQEINRHQSETYRLGIICPYKAQATLVEKLFASGNYDSKNVTIQVGTIHGFQGDECDIVISLFNPPPIISESPRMFLNKQNILNVAISRARDYLFIIMPDENTENISCLKRIQQIVKLINLKAKDNSTEYQASRIEQVMFKKNNFIEQNSFSTTHQSVNVYSEAEVLYEIRCEETAIDIQVSRQKTKAQISIDPKLPYFKQSVIPKEEILSHSIQNGDKI
jgi:superfamily I DNA and/or RNA helicase